MYLIQEKYKFTHYLNSVVCKLQHTSLPTAYSKAKKNKIHKHYNEIQEESKKIFPISSKSIPNVLNTLNMLGENAQKTIGSGHRSQVQVKVIQNLNH